MVLEKQPFRQYRLEDERASDSRRTLNISLNEKEDALLKELKELFDIRTDGRVIKLCMRISRNVLHRTFDEQDLKYLFKKERARHE